MEKNLQNHYKNVLVYDFLTKLNFQNVFKIPKITKICLNIGFKNANIDKKRLITIILLLKLITNQKPIPTRSRKNNLFLKIKKNSITGCRVTLRKNNIFNFLEKIIIFIMPTLIIKDLEIKNKNIFNFQIKNILEFFELRTEFLRFKNIPPIDVSIHTNADNADELFLVLNSFLILKKT